MNDNLAELQGIRTELERELNAACKMARDCFDGQAASLTIVGEGSRREGCAEAVRLLTVARVELEDAITACGEACADIDRFLSWS